MVAYSFQKRFAGLVETGVKTQTIRGHRKRHARPGEPIQLYAGMRTKACRKLVDPDPVCTSVANLTIWVPTRFELAHVVMAGRREYVTAKFAGADGFDSAEDFTRWWFDTHGPGEFHGVLIRWGRG